jgi:hypothetical protein
MNLFLNISPTSQQTYTFNQTLFVNKTGFKSAFVANNKTYVTDNEANGCVVVNNSGSFSPDGNLKVVL